MLEVVEDFWREAEKTVTIKLGIRHGPRQNVLIMDSISLLVFSFYVGKSPHY